MRTIRLTIIENLDFFLRLSRSTDFQEVDEIIDIEIDFTILSSNCNDRNKFFIMYLILRRIVNNTFILKTKFDFFVIVKTELIRDEIFEININYTLRVIINDILIHRIEFKSTKLMTRQLKKASK